MKTHVVVEETVARSRDEVSAYMSDWNNDTEWIGAIDEARQVSEGPFGVGAQVLRAASFLGRRIEYVNEVTELEPGRRLAMRSVEAPFPMTVVYEWEDADGGTRVRIRAGGDASGFYRMAGPLLAVAVRRGIAGDLRRVKRRLEDAARA